MAFGFPARHQETVSITGSGDGMELVRASLYVLGWRIREDEADRVIASTGIGVRSWGERVEVVREADGRLSITSRCALVTQCLDWGKNRANVHRLRDELRRMQRDQPAR